MSTRPPKSTTGGPGPLTAAQRAAIAARQPERLALIGGTATGRNVPPPTVAAPTRADRTLIVCKLYGAPLDLTEEILAAKLSVKEVFTLLAAACGDCRELSPAGATAVRLGLQAHAQLIANAATTAEAERRQDIENLCRRHGVGSTFLAQALGNSGHSAATLAPLLASRANADGRVPPGVHAGLVRDLCLIQRSSTK